MHLCFLVLAAALIGSSSASPNEATFDFNYGFDPAVISMEMVNYADSEGTGLRVSKDLIESTKAFWMDPSDEHGGKVDNSK